MRVTFRRARLAKLCSSEKDLVRTLGTLMARRVMARLGELEAATTLEDVWSLPQARAPELRGDRHEQISLDLVHPQRLVVSVGDDPVPRRDDGGLEWMRITAVVVEEITDTHD